MLAQLKGVQQDLHDSSDEMDESSPSSSTAPNSNVETVSDVKINVKVEKEAVGRDGDRVSKEDQVERVEQTSADSESSVVGTHPVSAVADTAGVSGMGSSAVPEGSVAGTHPVSVVADTAGVSDIGSSAAPEGSVAGIHPVSAAAGGSDRSVDTAVMRSNSSRRASSSGSSSRKKRSFLSPYRGWCYSQTRDSTRALGV